MQYGPSQRYDDVCFQFYVYLVASVLSVIKYVMLLVVSLLLTKYIILV